MMSSLFATLPSQNIEWRTIHIRFTPVSCKIVPLNRNEVEEGRKTLFLPDLTGVKIYETLELGSDGNEEGDTTTEESDDYEVVTFKNNKVVPSTLQRPPRSLKSSCK